MSLENFRFATQTANGPATIEIARSALKRLASRTHRFSRKTTEACRAEIEDIVQRKLMTNPQASICLTEADFG